MAQPDYAAITAMILRWTGAERPLFAYEHGATASADSPGESPLAFGSVEHEALLHYVQTALGAPDPEEFEALLDDEDSPELETFLEFLLFPDDALRRALEPLLDSAVSADGIQQIIGTLEASDAVFRLLLPEGADHRVVEISIPEWMWSGMVTRLQLGGALGEELVALVEQTVPQSLQLEVRILLRSKRWLTVEQAPTSSSFSLSLLQRGYIYRFFQLFPASDPAYMAALSLWLHLLGELAPDDLVLPAVASAISLQIFEKTAMASSPCLDEAALRLSLAGSVQDEGVWRRIVDRQRSLSKALRGSWDFAEKLKRYNMETLMMQGALTSYVSEDGAREELRLLQRLSLAILGRPAAEGEEVAELLLNMLAPEPDLSGVMLRFDKLDPEKI